MLLTLQVLKEERVVVSQRSNNIVKHMNTKTGDSLVIMRTVLNAFLQSALVENEEVGGISNGICQQISVNVSLHVMNNTIEGKQFR